MAIDTINKILPRKGGVSKIELFATGDFESIEYDFDSDKFVDIRLRQGATRAEYRFREGEALYEEKIEHEYGETIVTHKLTIALSVSPYDAIRAVEELGGAQGAGVIAIVHTNGSGRLLVGYSQRFGAKFPLKLAAAESTSGKTLASQIRDTITLQSEDTCKARQVTT